MSKVYITQEVSSVDYKQAVEFGDLVFVTDSSDRLSPHLQSTNNDHIIEKIKRMLLFCVLVGCL